MGAYYPRRAEAYLKLRLNPVLQQLSALVILAGFVWFIEAYVGWARLLAPWTRMPAGMLIGAIILTFVTYGLRALRLYDYFYTDMRGAFGLTCKLMLQHNLLNNLLPMRSGEISFPVLMTRYFQVPLARSVPTLLWFRVLDLLALAACAAALAGYYWLGPAFALATSVAFVVLPWYCFRLAAAWGKRVTDRPGRLAARLRDMGQALPTTAVAFWRSWGWTLVNWVVKLGAFAWILMFFVEAPFAGAWTGVVAGDLSSVLPIHGVAGVGTYEAGVVAGLVPFGVTAGDALPAAVNLHLFVLATTLLGGAISLFIATRKTHGPSTITMD